MASPHDIPTTEDMLIAIRNWMTTTLSNHLEGQLKFHTRVAANMIGMIERELRFGAKHAADHARRLAELGFKDDGELARAIRSGAIDYRRSDLRTAVMGSVRDKLSIANPRYLEI